MSDRQALLLRAEETTTRAAKLADDVLRPANGISPKKKAADQSPNLSRGIVGQAPCPAIGQTVGLGADVVPSLPRHHWVHLQDLRHLTWTPRWLRYDLMNEIIRPRSFGQAGSLVEAPAEKLIFLRKVYTLFTGSVVTASIGAMVALYAGADLSRVSAPIGRAVVTVPPLVAFFANHWIIGMMLFLGAFFGASAVRERPGVNVAALFGASFMSGLYIAPMLWLVQIQATQGMTLSTAPVRDAFLLTVLGFTGLTSYALLSKRDFSFLGGFLSMGLWVLIGASLLSFFVGGASFSLAIASVGVLLFGGYILYDTSRILRDPTNRDAVGAAIGLYLNFLNLFLFLLRILSSGRRDS